MPPSNSCTEPRYERVSLFGPRVHHLSPVQQDIVLLCAIPRTIGYLIAELSIFYPRIRNIESRIWQDIVLLRSHGLMRVHPAQPVKAPALHLPSLPIETSWRFAA